MRQQHIFDLLSSFSSSPPYFYAGLGTQYYVTTVSRDIFGRAMPGTYCRAESAYFKREKDDSRDILTAFKDRRRFLDISNYEKQKKKISCHMHFKSSKPLFFDILNVILNYTNFEKLPVMYTSAFFIITVNSKAR